MMMKEDADLFTGSDLFEGYVADILRLVAARLRFDYEIFLSTDGKYGEQNHAGQWNGLIGELVRGVSMHLVLGINSRNHRGRFPSVLAAVYPTIIFTPMTIRLTLSAV